MSTMYSTRSCSYGFGRREEDPSSLADEVVIQDEGGVSQGSNAAEEVEVIEVDH
jgi:hypothetical protein